ncbi:hypothetical protein J2X19_004609 [Rhodoferax ferrireducens]|uniref:DUF2145 domain-containing protein n=1 Tax=Rhodoferax ferrireducens TaxID=192843 RepID=A0ABU2CF28_9BURK|nr:DUF2145 domain-containing protein [Rhodoferax ferrireducens]MDR7379913.1 hypothetical protein [Rhodoferax ferrireducens]
MRLQILPAICLCVGLWLAPPALAGRSCDAEQPPKAATIERGLTLAERTLVALDASGARVVILARAGQDLSPYGLRYSHLGFAYRQPDGQGGYVWRVLHKLNQCGTPDASIYRQGLGEFFMDDLWRYEAAWAVPTPEVQERLLVLLQDTPRATRLHSKPYSLVSYAWATKYQQSNQWALETLAAAMEPSTDSRERAQAWLKFKGYTPTTLKIGPLTRLGARATKANVAFDDHPNEKRFSDRIETITVDSVFSWLQRAQLAGAPVQLAL